MQQADTRATKNSPNNINTEQNLKAVLDQVQINQADFGKAVQANKEAGSNEAKQNLAAVDALLAETVTTKQFPQETPSVVLGGNQPQVTNGGNRNGGDGGNKNGGNKNGGNKNGGNKNGGNKNGGDGGNGGQDGQDGRGSQGGQDGRGGQGGQDGQDGRGGQGGDSGKTRNGNDGAGGNGGRGGRGGAKKRRHQH